MLNLESDGFIKVFTPDGEEHKVQALEGWRVMEIMRDAGLPVLAECGGACSCATCHIHLGEVWFGKCPDPTLEEFDMLDTVEEFEEGRSRLACQIIYRKKLDGLTVSIPLSTVQKTQS